MLFSLLHNVRNRMKILGILLFLDEAYLPTLDNSKTEIKLLVDVIFLFT